MVELSSDYISALNALSYDGLKTATISSSSYITGAIDCWHPREHPTSCPNCGAPVTNQKCEYCGTMLWN